MKSLRFILGTVLTIVALNAFGGGYYGMTGAEGVPLDWLKGSPFSSYFIPSLILFFVIGGSCLISAITVFANSIYATKLSYVSGILLLSWITLQIIFIGYVSWLQPAIFFSGIVVLILTKYLHRTKY